MQILASSMCDNCAIKIAYIYEHTRDNNIKSEDYKHSLSLYIMLSCCRESSITIQGGWKEEEAPKGWFSILGHPVQSAAEKDMYIYTLSSSAHWCCGQFVCVCVCVIAYTRVQHGYNTLAPRRDMKCTSLDVLASGQADNQLIEACGCIFIIYYRLAAMPSLVPLSLSLRHVLRHSLCQLLT